MRTKLPNLVSERVHARQRRSEPAAALLPAPARSSAEGPSDPALQRVRDAGGPVDHACYSCECGYVFVAKVSTTVTCPRCRAGQAW